MRRKADPRTRLPGRFEVRYTDVSLGRMRSRSMDRPGGPEVVVVQGMAVSDYLLKVYRHWRRNGRNEPAELTSLHLPEWVRAGPRRLFHLVRVHLTDPLESILPTVVPPVLVLRGENDGLLTRGWAVELAKIAVRGTFREVPGAHTFPWSHPDAWSEPIRSIMIDVSPGRRG